MGSDKWSLMAWIAHSEALDREREIALQAAFQSAKEAVTKAEVAADKRFELLNELRSGVATKEQLEVLAQKLDAATETHIREIGSLTSRMDLNQGQDTGTATSRTDRRIDQNTVIALVVAAGAIVGLAIKVAGG